MPGATPFCEAAAVNTGPLPVVPPAGPVPAWHPGRPRRLGPLIRVVWSHQLPPGAVMPQGGAMFCVAGDVSVLVVDSALTPRQRRAAIRRARGR